MRIVTILMSGIAGWLISHGIFKKQYGEMICGVINVACAIALVFVR